MSLLQYPRMNCTISSSILSRAKKRPRRTRRKMRSAKCNTSSPCQHRREWEIPFNCQVRPRCSPWTILFKWIRFRWSNHSITSEYVLEYCDHGGKCLTRGVQEKINRMFSRAHKVLNNNIPSDLESDELLGCLNESSSSVHFFVQWSDIVYVFVSLCLSVDRCHLSVTKKQSLPLSFSLYFRLVHKHLDQHDSEYLFVLLVNPRALCVCSF